MLSIEGIDGCGKSTHTKLLARWLRGQGYDVVVTDEPTDGTIGKIIKLVIKGELKVPAAVEALLFAADRANHVADLIEPALRTGKIVLNERYIYSSLAYQSARGLSTNWIKKINQHAPKPDLTILIDVPADAAFSRIKSSRSLDEFEKDVRLQKQVRRNYLRIARQEGLKVVDGARPLDEVQAEIRGLVVALLHR